MVTKTATTYNRAYSPRAYGDQAGMRLIGALEGAGVDPFAVSQAVSLGDSLGLTPRHTLALLHRLADGAWITRIKKGLYALNDPVTRMPKAHPFAIGTSLVTPSAVSHWSALQHWGLTEQVPVTVTVSSPTRTYPPEDRGQGAAGRPAWIVAGVRYQVIAVTRERFFGVTRVWVSERNEVPLFDRERALLDAFHHFHIFGSPSVAMDILDKHLADIDADRLIGYAMRLKVTAVVKRLGWMLDHFRVARTVLEPLMAYPARGESPLDPGRPARGHHNFTWHVIENLRDSQ